MAKGKRRSKNKKKAIIPKNAGSGGSAGAAAPPRAAGAAGEIANRECIGCDNCGIASPQTRCSRCLCAYYCSKECQRAHWKDHKRNCDCWKDERDHYNAARDRNNLPGGTPAVVDGPCAICLEEEVKSPVRFECGHAFCFDCVFMYQIKEDQATCPYCRGEISDEVSKARNRIILYIKRAQAAGEESAERKRYYHLAMVEHEAVLRLAPPEELPHLLYFKAYIIAIAKDPDALLEVSDKYLLGHSSGECVLDQKHVFQAKLWQAQAYSGMEQWVKASEIYRALWEENQQMDYGHMFQLIMGYCRCLFELAYYDKAIECGNHAVTMSRGHAGVHEYLALAQKAVGDIDAAKNTMSKAILHETPWNTENLKRNEQILRNL